MDHSLFELLGTEGQLGCFQFEVIMNTAAVNICVHVLHKHTLSFLWDKSPKGQLLGHMISTCLVVKKLPNCILE